MDELKSHLLSIAIMLVITGIISKLIPEKSNKTAIRFVVNLILIISIFGVDLSSIYEVFEKDYSLNFSQQTVTENEINDRIVRMLNEEIKTEIDSEIQKINSRAYVDVTMDENALIIEAFCEEMSPREKVVFEDVVRNKFEGNIQFIYTVVD